MSIWNNKTLIYINENEKKCLFVEYNIVRFALPSSYLIRLIQHLCFIRIRFI